MGSIVTVDKHLTNIEQWIEVAKKLDNIDFDSQITSHLGLWKLSETSTGQIQTAPVQIQSDVLSQIFNKNQCYILYAIKKSESDNPENYETIFTSQLSLCLENLKSNILKSSIQVPLKKAVVEGNQYRIYALIGKKSKPKVRILASSYALKLEEVLNSKKKLQILSGGGVLRNRKLQKGSTLPLISQQGHSSQNFSIINLNQDNSEIDVVNFFQQGPNKSGVTKRKPLSILSHKSESFLPEIKSQSRNIENVDKEASSSKFQEKYNGTQNQKVVQQQQRPSKKIGLEKMSLKLDFSKPLNLGSLNLATKKQSGLQIENGSSNFIQSVGITNRSEERRGKRQKCEQQCSQIIEGLYVSGQKVAKNYETLQKYQVKYIVNCAGDYCQNWFEEKGIEYLTFFLKDSQNQNIECLFYRVIQFIQNAHKNKQNVLIHCIQGISRSITFVVAYIIFKYGYDYKKAESFVKQKRSIACPNNGFMVELIQFHKRLYDEYDSLNKPRVFLVSSHSKQTPHILTARMLKTPLFDSKKYVGLDSRGVYIVHIPEVVYIWVGSKCDQQKLQNYWTYANDFVKKLQKYERAPLKVKAISEGSQQKQFLAIWNLIEAPKLYENTEYDRLFLQGDPARPGLQRQFYEQIEEEEAQSRKLFIYPDFKTGLGVFSLEDLSGMCILTIVAQQKSKKSLALHIWKDQNFNEDENLSDEDFLSKVIETNFANVDDENIQIIEEEYEKPSETFKESFKN